MLSESCNRVDADSGLSSGLGVNGVNSNSNQTLSTTKIVTRMLRICDSKWSSGGGQQRLNRDSSSYNTPENLEQLQSLYTSSASSATNSAMLTETVLDCVDAGSGRKHHLLQSAHFHELADGSDDSILFMTFNSSTTPSTSAVCKLTMREIDAHFVTMLRKCLDGDNSYAELVSPYSNKYTWKTPCRCSVITDFSRKLPQADLVNERRLFCHNDFFNYMNSRRALTVRSIGGGLPVTRPITAIVSTNVEDRNGHIVMALATLDAHVLLLDYDLNSDVARLYDQVSLAGGPLKPAIVTSSVALGINLAVVEVQHVNSSTRRVLYATYDHYLYKINLQNCEQYRTCEMCLNGALNGNHSVTEAQFTQVPNPFCGWCLYEQRCTVRAECLKQRTVPATTLQEVRATADSLWLAASARSASTIRCPSISSVWPSRYVNPTSSGLAHSDYYVFSLNVPLISSVEYYCDITASIFQRAALISQPQITSSRVPASFLNESTLRCDLMPIKVYKKFYFFKSHPIKL